MDLRIFSNTLGVEPANCKSCIHYSTEFDGDYGEIFCGAFCLYHDPQRNSDEDILPEHSCIYWYPDFWQTKFTATIDGSDESVRLAMHNLRMTIDEAIKSRHQI